MMLFAAVFLAGGVAGALVACFVWAALERDRGRNGYIDLTPPPR